LPYNLFINKTRMDYRYLTLTISSTFTQFLPKIPFSKKQVRIEVGK
jgi:hypothetical protein